MYTEQIDAQCSKKIDQTYNINWHWTKLMLNVKFKVLTKQILQLALNKINAQCWIEKLRSNK